MVLLSAKHRATKQIVGRTEKVDVVRHDKVVTHKPGPGLKAPDFDQRVVNCFVRHPRNGILGIHRDEENVRLTKKDVRAARRCFASDVRIHALAGGHVEMVRVFRREEKKEFGTRWNASLPN